MKAMFDARTSMGITQKELSVRSGIAQGDISKMEINTEDKNIDKQRLVKDKPYAFEHICIADTRELERLNNQLGYANKMNIRELRKIIKEYCVRFVNNMRNFDQGFYPTINDLLNTWTNIESFVQTANAGIQVIN